jgi:hypothetical protein
LIFFVIFFFFYFVFILFCIWLILSNDWWLTK